jgi:hypothetical protein
MKPDFYWVWHEWHHPVVFKNKEDADWYLLEALEDCEGSFEEERLWGKVTPGFYEYKLGDQPDVKQAK